ncbi:MAG: MotA/TolQ/ExbB proton channel family protein, partial [Fibrobacterales bacterium]|nr:MotA/TolQ/ExbB proton channel family protein [Fibrobacterales bacterium]
MPNLFYVFVEAVRATYRAGGVAMLPIILAGTVGFHFVFRSWIRIGGDFFRKDVGSVVEALESDL